MATVFLFLLLLHLPPFLVVARPKGKITVGSSLTAGSGTDSLWLSPSEDFAFGFHQLQNDSFILAIWYYKLSGQFTTVWYANGGNPAPRNSKLDLTSENGLVLKYGAQQLWRSGKARPAEVGYAVMNDRGNFILLGVSSKPLWESFNHPTDTLLPSQIMELGGFLSARKSNSDFTPRRFQFPLDVDGIARLITINLRGNHIYNTYYSTGDASNAGYRVVFDSLSLYVLRRDGSKYFIRKLEDPVSNPLDYYMRVSLNFDGALTISSHSKDPSAANETWRTITSIPDDVCSAVNGEKGGGVCGFNSICSIQSDGRTNCTCPDGYSLFNPTDAYSGCRPNFILGSVSGQLHQENHFMQEIPNVNFPFSDYEVLSFISREGCKNACLHDCLCAAAIFSPYSMRCWKKRPPLSNGKVELNDAIAYLKTANIPHKDQSIVVFPPSSVLSGHSVFVNSLFMSAIIVGSFLYLKRMVPEVEVSPNESRLHQFSYKELAKATDGFKVELGRGSSGIVYRDETRSTGLIAVKMLDRVFEDNNTKFKREVNIIGQTNHKNLVRLVGYCDEKQHRLLVYEFLRNGTLARYLFGEVKPSWKQRKNIAFGIAGGLNYLHEECRKQIIHCDIKPQNILLDENFDAQISDFGLANLLPRNQINTKTKIGGTEGYVAPDWFRAGPVSVKVDVYSFGVVLLEIICCRRNEDLETDGKFFIKWVYDCCLKGELGDLVKNDKEAMDDIKMVERFVKVAIWCVQDDPHIKPTMKKVMLMLEEILQVSVPPSPVSSSSLEIEDIVSGV